MGSGCVQIEGWGKTSMYAPLLCRSLHHRTSFSQEKRNAEKRDFSEGGGGFIEEWE